MTSKSYDSTRGIQNVLKTVLYSTTTKTDRNRCLGSSIVFPPSWGPTLMDRGSCGPKAHFFSPDKLPGPRANLCWPLVVLCTPVESSHYDSDLSCIFPTDLHKNESKNSRGKQTSWMELPNSRKKQTSFRTSAGARQPLAAARPIVAGWKPPYHKNQKVPSVRAGAQRIRYVRGSTQIFKTLWYFCGGFLDRRSRLGSQPHLSPKTSIRDCFGACMFWGGVYLEIVIES